jgi:hypothetical protein
MLPGYSGGQAPTRDTAVGSGSVSLPPSLPGGLPIHLFSFDLSAGSGPSGQNPTGEVSLTLGERAGVVEFEGNVKCLAVSGNHAAIGAVGSLSGLPAAELITVVDGGPANSDTAWVVPNLSQTPAPPDCAAASFSDQKVVTNGDIVVVDASPMPTSKDQCKNGGWRTYGSLRTRATASASSRQEARTRRPTAPRRSP